MGSVCGLVLGSHIPPRVIMDDDIRRSQVKAGPPCFQAYQEYRHLILSKISHQPDSFFLGGGTCQHVAFDSLLLKPCMNNIQHGGKLGKQ